MANRRQRRTFTEAFKAEAVRLVREEGKSVSAAARTLMPSVATPTAASFCCVPPNWAMCRRQNGHQIDRSTAKSMERPR